eukprot:6213127-Pleurochrysis_carterae.AAC.2
MHASLCAGVHRQCANVLLSARARSRSRACARRTERRCRREDRRHSAWRRSSRGGRCSACPS